MSPVAPGELHLRKFVAPEFLFGHGARRMVARFAAHFDARKALLVTDPGILAAGWVAEVEIILKEAGIAIEIFPQVTPNPRAEEVMAGVEAYHSSGCDVLIAVGGGSPIDAAKGIGAVATNDGHVLDFVGVDKVPRPLPPLICIPTTCGSSADVSQFAIINNTPNQVKEAIISKAMVPDASLVDPETLATMDPKLAACVSLDALTHAIEAFFSLAHAKLTDLMALEAIRLIHQNLVPFISDRQDPARAEAMMQASLLAGLAFSNASLGATHAMAHSLGGLLDLPHGECNALLLEHVVAFNAAEIPERSRELATALGLDGAALSLVALPEALRDRLHALRCAAGIQSSLGSAGMDPSAIHELARKALLDPCVVTNPRRPTIEDLERIYEAAR